MQQVHPVRATLASLLCLLGTSLLPGQRGNEAHPAGWVERFGAFLPRPVDPQERQSLAFAPPREHDVILAELDALAAEMAPIAAVNDVFKQRAGEYRAMQRRRINLVSELEESGYRGDRLATWLATKLSDIDTVWPADGVAATSYDRLRREVARRHPGSAAALQARADGLLDFVRATLRAEMRVHPGDYDRLAEVELARKNDPKAGILILEALVGERRRGESGDPELAAHWKDWILENLGPGTLGYRTVMRERMFGAPIRLEGEGFDGERLDTAQWRGDVILVDFWGTWCVPCREAMPHLGQMLDKYGARGLRVVGVLCDHEIHKAETWLQEQGFTWPQLVDRSLTATRMLHPIAERYAIGGFPTLWIIDRKGVLREDVDRDELEATLQRYLDEGK